MHIEKWAQPPKRMKQPINYLDETDVADDVSTFLVSFATPQAKLGSPLPLGGSGTMLLTSGRLLKKRTTPSGNNDSKVRGTRRAVAIVQNSGNDDEERTPYLEM